MSNQQNSDNSSQSTPKSGECIPITRDSANYQVRIPTRNANNVVSVSLNAAAQKEEASNCLETLEAEIISGQQQITLHTVSLVIIAAVVGQRLIEAKKRFEHGQFNRWIIKNITPHCGLGLRTAQRYMDLARNQSKLLAEIIARHERNHGVSMTLQQAGLIAEQMSLRSADALLKGKTSTTSGRQDDGVLSEVIELASEFFEMPASDELRSSAPTCDAAVEANWLMVGDEFLKLDETPTAALIAPESSKQNIRYARHALDLHEALPSARLIVLLDDRNAKNWLPLLDTFSRVVIRNRVANTTRLFGLFRKDLQDHFAKTFESLGPVFFPFNAGE